MTVTEAVEKLYALQKKMAAYSHAANMLYLDGVTNAPAATAAVRGETLAVLGEVSYTLATGEETGELLDFLHEHREELDAKTRRTVYLMRKELRELRCIPMEEYIEYEKLVNEAESVWHRAKADNDYAAFEPYLAKIVETNRRFAGYMAPDKAPYDVLLDKFEPGLTMEKCDAFFAALRERIVPLVHKVCAAEQLSDAMLHGNFPIDAQRKLSDRLMEILCIDRSHCGIAETEHPFTIEFTKYDVRITTHYNEEDFSSSMFSVIHEGGHALYELNTADEYAYTNLGTGVSMGIHESQSRFFENLLCRSKEFSAFLLPELQKFFPQLAGYSAEYLYRAVNRSQPSLIRTEADELTYSLHVLVRYELEKKLISGELSTKDLPEAWNALYKEYLGVDVPDDKRGVLQDSHWSGGAIGYFPSYALGSAYGAQIIEKMKADVDLAAALKKGDLSPVNDWLQENIWQHGSMYEPAELLQRVLGTDFAPSYYTDYLEKKYSELYSL